MLSATDNTVSTNSKNAFSAYTNTLLHADVENTANGFWETHDLTQKFESSWFLNPE